MTSLVVVSAGLRVPSTTAQLADQLSAAAARELGLLESPVEVTRIEVRDHAHAIADALLTGFPIGELAEAISRIGEADALVLVTPTFQASYSGLFKSFFDLIPSLAGVPVLLAATGGTERHSLVLDYALRPLVSYLGGVTVPTGVYAATADLGGPGAPKLGMRIDRAAAELATLTAGSPLPRRRRDDFADVTPFEEQLRRLRP
jgi:FMN reductase